MSLLVISDPGDVHASALAWAVHAYGTDALIWSPAPPWTDPGSVRFEDGAPIDYRFGAKGGDVTPSSIDAVWLRRWSRPHFPDSFGEGEKKAAGNELLAFHRGVLQLLPADILWANPLAARDAANLKLRQLAAARSAGFPIPRTLVTDDAAQAKDFVKSCPQGEAIYKPFHTFQWEAAGIVSHSVTTIVTAADFDEPEQLVWSPGIFQRYAFKACELRICVFGRTCVAIRISGQDPIDWRTRQSDMKIEPHVLPAPIERKIHELMDGLGIVMGMIDLIVTPDGDHVFLEVNEQGQFLWIEEMCPDVTLLDICARFFASGDRRFQAGTAASAKVKLADFDESPAIEDMKKEGRDFSAAGGIRNALVMQV